MADFLPIYPPFSTDRAEQPKLKFHTVGVIVGRNSFNSRGKDNFRGCGSASLRARVMWFPSLALSN